MQNFELYLPTQIIFGKDKENEIGALLKGKASKVLIHYGKSHVKKCGLYDKVTKSLDEENIPFVSLGGVKPNPEIGLVREGVELCKKENVDFILAVGGGSVIDSAKAIALGAVHENDVWDFYFNGVVPEKALPIGTILTIPAAGSEMSKFSVITNEEYKVGYGNDILRPKFSILNPELTYSLPKWQTAAGIVDIMAHVMERYFTIEENVYLTDGMCEALLKTMMRYAPVLMKDPNNYEARAEVMFAGTVAHNGLLGMGRIEDWASHRLQMPLSALYDVTHGAGLSIIFPAWIKYVSKFHKKPFIKFFVRVFDLEYNFDDENAVIERGIKLLENFYQSIDMPIRLSDLDIGDEDFEKMAEIVTVKGPQGNLKKIYKEDALEIYKLAK